MSVSRIAYKVMNGFACIKLLSGVYLVLRINPNHFGDDPDYDPYPGVHLTKNPNLDPISTFSYFHYKS